MFKLRYNFLVLVQITTGVLNSIFLLKLFGANEYTDAYFMLLALYNALFLVQTMPVEQFMFFYNDAKANSLKDSREFFNFSLVLSVFIGLLFFIFIYFLKSLIVKLFAYNLDTLRYSLLVEFLDMYKYIFLVAPFNYVCSALLLAEMKISYHYIFLMLPNLFVSITLLIMWLTDINNMILIVITGIMGYYFAFISYIGLIFFNMKFKFEIKIKHYLAKSFIRNSLTMKLGHNIHNFLFPVITNNFLSYFPAGFVSYFYYAQKIMSVLQNFVTGPSMKILQSRISFHFSTKKIKEIQNDIKLYFKKISHIYIILIVLTYFAIPYVLKYLAFSKIEVKDIYYIKNMFLLFSIWGIIIFIESPFDMFLITAKRSDIFIKVNSLFILNYLFLILILKKFFSIYSVLFSLIFSQLVSTILYYRTYKKVVLINLKFI